MTLFHKTLDLCRLQDINKGDLVSLMDTLNKYNPFFHCDIQRDAHEAFILLLEAFNAVCRKPKNGNQFSDIPEFMDYYFCGIFRKKFDCANCHEENIFFESFRNFIILPTEDISNFLAKQHIEKISITCDRCHLRNSQKLYMEIHEFPRILMLQINRFSTSSIHHRHRKNNQNMTVYSNVKFGFVEYELFGLIDHHGVLVDNGHYTCFVYHDHCWYHCNDINIEKAILPSSSQNMYLLFYNRK